MAAKKKSKASKASADGGAATSQTSEAEVASSGSVEGHSQDAESPGPARTFENRHERVAHEMKQENKAIKAKLAAERERSQALETRCTALWTWTLASTSISALLVFYLLRDRQRDRQALQEIRGKS